MFDLDRIVFDRSVWSVYFPSEILKSDLHLYNPGLIEKLDLERELKTTKFNGSGTEKVLYYEQGGPKPFLKIEIRLRQTRSMRVVFNFNRYFFQKHDMKHDIRLPVIHDDNFLPQDTTITTEDYIEVFRKTLPDALGQLYRQKYAQLWPADYNWILEKDEQPVVRCVTLELAREMKPLDVEDVKSDLVAMGVKMKRYATPFSSYNSQSKTLLFGERPEIENLFYEGDAKLSANLDVWNWKESYQHVRQAKLYQKSIDLARFECTLYDRQIDFSNDDPVEDMKFILDEYAESCGIIWKSKKKVYDEMKIYIANQFRIDVSVIDFLFNNNFIWKSTKENIFTTRRLKRRGILQQVGRGQYVCSSNFINIFKGCDERKIKSNILNLL